jgi:hypothetical protein
LHVPVIVNKQGIVLDGHHRFRACKELGIPLQFQTEEFNDSLEEKQFLIEVNLRRRQLNEFQRVEIGYSLENIEKERAKRRMSLGGQRAGLANKKEETTKIMNKGEHLSMLPLNHVRRKGRHLR